MEGKTRNLLVGLIVLLFAILVTLIFISKKMPKEPQKMENVQVFMQGQNAQQPPQNTRTQTNTTIIQQQQPEKPQTSTQPSNPSSQMNEQDLQPTGKTSKNPG